MGSNSLCAHRRTHPNKFADRIGAGNPAQNYLSGISNPAPCQSLLKLTALKLTA